MNWKNTSCPMMTIAKEWPKEMKHGKATEKLLGGHNPRIRETSTMWKILSPTKATGPTQEEDSHPEEGEEEEDPRDSRITTQKTLTSIASITEGATAPKGAPKQRKTWQEFSKKKR
jgi:hypothetical protein